MKQFRVFRGLLALASGRRISSATPWRRSGHAGPGLRIDLVGKVFLVLFSIAAQIPAEGPQTETAAHDWRLDGKGFERVVDPAAEFFRGSVFDQAVGASESEARSLDTVFHLEHDVPIGDGLTLRVHEAFTLGAWLRWPHRAVLVSSSFTGASWRAPIEGYNGHEILARQGLFTFTVDLLGTGGSSKPESGFDADFEAQVAALEKVLRYIRFFRAVPEVDLLGDGYGSAISNLLAADTWRVRSCVMTSNLYVEQVGGPAADPAFQEMVRGDEDGYIYIPRDVFGVFVQGSPPEFQAYFAETQEGNLPAPSFMVAFDLPFFDPGVARVPGKIIQGEHDIVAGPNDPYLLAAAYGTDGADVVIIEGAGRAPRLETPERAARFWQEVIDYLRSEP